ncbi:5-bromo-4-chloroindolyl phosphate hydrolysis family protein [Zongyangia hominis]|uniref:5-bromo-4-chloroindolyl phosphate hydrolysis family protein n=1 Tax=Zongyangia hominis TaxID=2763677 RepID=A0A926IBL3_9FIRM|nr:5-bromo-4-chloroindolyl phosphate hydrolysis family protein [Zongyangia hominis]MBC8570302.1 5-bromo-4-chloroindolyl phosphate hydrolysis family protein [Zongyangia hominis]
MREDNLSNLGRDIGRAVRNVLNSSDFEDLKDSIHSAVQNISRPPYTPPPPPDPRYDPFGPGNFQQGGPGPGAPGGQQPPREPWQWKQSYQQSYQRWSRPRPPRQQAKNYQPPYRPPVMNRQVAPYAQGKSSTDLGAFFLAFGMILTCVFGFLICWSVYNFLIGTMVSLSPLVILGPAFAIGLVLMGRGNHLRGRFKRYRQYQKVLNGRTYCSIKELADSVGERVEFVVKDLEKMIKDRLFPQGHLDEQKTCLMTDEATYAQYLETQRHLKEIEEEERRARELREKDPEAAALQEMLAEGARYREEIRRANDAIPGEIISQKLDRLEEVTAKIFEYVEGHPKKLPDIRKFMSYYLPITLKLVGAYRDFDGQPVQGENILSAKKEIEETLDTINLAFENLLDGLFEDDALDISTDISALETMLAQEGLTGQKFGSHSADGR